MKYFSFLSLAVLCLIGCSAYIRAVDLDQYADNAIFVYTNTPKSSKEYLQELCKDNHFNEVYNKLSRAEQKQIKNYCDAAVTLWAKVAQGKMDCNVFKQEAQKILKPYEALAQKLVQSQLYVFNLAVASKYGEWSVCYKNKWPEGFGIVVRTEIGLGSDSPKNADEYLKELLAHAEIAAVYATLSFDEQKSMYEFCDKAVQFYTKVQAAQYNHKTFQEEAPVLLQPYYAVAKKFADHNLFPFKLIVIWFQDNAQNWLLRVGYVVDYSNTFGVVSWTTA